MYTNKKSANIILSTALLVASGVLFYTLLSRNNMTDMGENLTVLNKAGEKVTLKDLEPRSSDKDKYIAGLLGQKFVPNGFYEFGSSDSRGNVFLTTGLPGNKFAMLLRAVDKKTEQILWETSSSLIFSLPVKSKVLVDLNNDGYLDIYIQTLSANYLNIERPWFFIYKNGDYRLATPLLPEGVDQHKALSREVPSVNAMEIRTNVSAKSLWLRDLDGDSVYELITLDQRYYPDPGEVIAELTKRIYKLQNDVFVLQNEAPVTLGSEEYREIISWPTIPEEN